MYVIFINYTDDCTYSYNVVYAICDNEVSAIEAQEQVQKQLPDKVVEISEQMFNLNQIYLGGIPY